jgi:prevent-host-death family protein
LKVRVVATRLTSREFNQDTSRAKKAAETGPVFITDRGRPAHVLLTFDAYEKLLGVDLLDRLAEPAGVEDIDLPVSVSDQRPRPAAFD